MNIWESYDNFRSYLLQHPPYCKGCKPPTPMVLVEEWPGKWKIEFRCTACGDRIIAEGFPGKRRIKWYR